MHFSSFKRGPPKGYIHAIEQRWHQVECLLGTIMASPRANSIMTDLRQDPFAREVLDRVDTGPYGPAGRARQPTGAPPDSAGFYNTIMTQSQQPISYDDRRSKRQSRLSRELVSSQDTTVPAIPTAEWQDQLYRRLSSHLGSGLESPMTTYSSPSDPTRFASWSSSGSTSPMVAIPTSLPGMSGEPSRRRRRLDAPYVPSDLQQEAQMYEQTDYEEEYDDAVSALGHLSVDENREIRYHGRSAGLHLLAKSDRTDDSQQKENGIWKFHMPRIESADECLSYEQVNERVQLPDVQTQDQLIGLYFTYVHPTVDAPRSSTQREPMQQVTKLLLLSMFAFAARYLPPSSTSREPTSAPTNWLLQAGMEYASDARRLLNTVYEDSRPSVCQALLLLGLREYGIGCMAQGWLYTGMGCRMAIDLGMNREADGWKDSRGNELFSAVEKQTRKQLWWSCCIADKLSSVWLGRPVMYRKGDFDTPEPGIDLNGDELWRPYPPDALGQDFTPISANVMLAFQGQCKLSFLTSEIMTRVYPVKWSSESRRRDHLDDLENSLHNWLIDLPEPIQYHENGKRPIPPPHVLVLHIEYYSAVLLLHRAFLPDWDGDMKFNPGHIHDPAALKSFDICQSAATRISSMISTFDEVYGLDKAPPLLTIYLQSAGIMHVVTLNQRPRDTQASIGLLQCIDAAEQMSEVWPAAIRIRNLLKGAKVQLDDYTAQSRASGRPKRRVEEALGSDRNSDLLQQQMYGDPAMQPSASYDVMHSQQAPYALHYNPAMQLPPASTVPYLPGSEWWPQLIGPAAGQGLPQQGYNYPPASAGTHLSGLPQSLFTFDQEQLSSDFMPRCPPRRSWYRLLHISLTVILVSSLICLFLTYLVDTYLLYQ
ncbi:hypothetical protein NM688_g1984 [Phlebia brevispora]|uniref:Uncharacterized protein n=1 Tax=Phlebia brevispora TaxID=194682 RepID=A0ACC1T9V9_9APHY|nr:hypothetical protein NM688_g1984 [Phlebia brevispora]